MDENTQSTIAVLGHPIAGNPSQFALERVLQHLELDWRVFSFGVPPQQLHTALAGLEVLGVRGVFIDQALSETAASWKESPEQTVTVDCFHRNEFGLFVGADCRNHLIRSMVQTRLRELEDSTTAKVFLAGDSMPSPAWQSDDVKFDAEQLPADLDRIPEAQAIIVGNKDGVPIELDVDEWPTDDDQNTLVIDISEGHPEWSLIESKGYKTVSAMQRQIETLGECFLRWSNQPAPADIMFDAIEEYLSV